MHLSEEYSASVAQKDAYASSYSFVRAKKGNILEYVLFYCLLRWTNERFKEEKEEYGFGASKENSAREGTEKETNENRSASA